MPRLSRDGTLWCSGIAGAGFYGGDFDETGRARVLVDQQNAGMRGFLTDSEGVTQFGDSQILGIDILTGQRRTVDPRGASEVQASDGTWAAFFLTDTPDAPPGTVQARTSTGLKIDHAYIGASTGPMRNDCVGPDGAVAIKDQYHSYGPWHVHRRDGSSWLLSTQDAVNIQLLGDDRAIFREGWTWVGVGVPFPKPLTEPAWNLRYLDTAEGPWIIYQENNGRVLAHPNGTPIGHVLGTATDAFGIDARVLADGRVRVIWATSEGEAPWSLMTAYFRLTDPRVSLIPEVQPPAEIAAFPRKLWLAPYYSHHARYGDTAMTEHAGNAICVIGDERDPAAIHAELDRIRPLGQAMIVDGGGEQPADINTNLTVAWLVGAGNPEALGTRVARVAWWAEKPIVAYLDGMGWPEARPTWITERVWPSVQAYRNRGESLLAFESRIGTVLARVTRYGVFIALTPGFYVRGGDNLLTPAEVVECMALYERWIRDYPVVCVMPFADRRPTGMLDYPEFRTWGKAFLAASERPSRWDYWTSDQVDPDFVLSEKLKQSTSNIALTQPEKVRLLTLLDEAPDPIDPPPPGLDPVTIDRCVQIIVTTGREWDVAQPGLRERDLEAWQALVAGDAGAQDWRIGRKSTVPGSPISRNALGLRSSRNSSRCEVAIDYIRDNPATPDSPTGDNPRGPNEWRDKPAVYTGLTQAWYPPT